MCIYIYIYVYIYIYIYTQIYVYIYIERERDVFIIISNISIIIMSVRKIKQEYTQIIYSVVEHRSTHIKIAIIIR